MHGCGNEPRERSEVGVLRQFSIVEPQSQAVLEIRIKGAEPIHKAPLAGNQQIVIESPSQVPNLGQPVGFESPRRQFIPTEKHENAYS